MGPGDGAKADTLADVRGSLLWLRGGAENVVVLYSPVHRTQHGLGPGLVAPHPLTDTFITTFEVVSTVTSS